MMGVIAASGGSSTIVTLEQTKVITSEYDSDAPFMSKIVHLNSAIYFVTDNVDNNKLKKYSLATAGDINSTWTYVNKSTNDVYTSIFDRTFSMSSDGLSLYAASGGGQYKQELTTAYDVSTLQAPNFTPDEGNYIILSSENTPVTSNEEIVTFDGKKVIFIYRDSLSNNIIETIELSTANDLTTAGTPLLQNINSTTPTLNNDGACYIKKGSDEYLLLKVDSSSCDLYKWNGSSWIYDREVSVIGQELIHFKGDENGDIYNLVVTGASVPYTWTLYKHKINL